MKARREAGETYYEAAKAMPDVGPQQLQNLEEGITDPYDVRVRTMLSIMGAYRLTANEFLRRRKRQRK